MAIIGIEKLSAEIENELSLYHTDVKNQLKKVTGKYAKELVKKTKATAPVGFRNSNKYRDSIACKLQSETLNGVNWIWYVNSKDSNYRLTHLLVHGHAKRGGGRTRENHFLTRAVEEIEKDYIREIEAIINNG